MREVKSCNKRKPVANRKQLGVTISRNQILENHPTPTLRPVGSKNRYLHLIAHCTPLCSITPSIKMIGLEIFDFFVRSLRFFQKIFLRFLRFLWDF